MMTPEPESDRHATTPGDTVDIIDAPTCPRDCDDCAAIVVIPAEANALVMPLLYEGDQA